MSELEANNILMAALRERRASELIDTLCNGGACSYDALDGTLVLLKAYQLDQLLEDDDDDHGVFLREEPTDG